MPQSVTEPPARYEPLPGVAQIPGWIWRRISRRVRVAVLVVVLAAAVAAVPLAASIRDTKREDEAAERREQRRERAELIRRLRAEQRPRTGRSVPGASRPRLRADLAAAILADARRRARAGEFPGMARRVVCEPRDPRRYTCTAVTAESREVFSGLPYRARVDRVSGRFAFCKVSGQAQLTRDPLVATPRACGG